MCDEGEFAPLCIDGGGKERTYTAACCSIDWIKPRSTEKSRAIFHTLRFPVTADLRHSACTQYNNQQVAASGICLMTVWS